MLVPRILGCLLGLAVPVRLVAQLSVRAGDRVRLTLASSGKQIAGAFQDTSRDSVWIRADRARLRSFSLDGVAGVERSFARGSYGKQGAILGAVTSGVALLGYTIFSGRESDAPGAVNLLGLTVFTAAGAGVGFVIGSAIRWETWQPAALNQVSILRVGLSLRTDLLPARTP